MPAVLKLQISESGFLFETKLYISKLLTVETIRNLENLDSTSDMLVCDFI